MNWFRSVEKNNGQLEGCAFKKHGFAKRKDSNKKVSVSVKEFEYIFDYETNKIYEIPSENIIFAICVSREKRFLFTNQDYIITDESTSPYRTFYDGLMKEPFRYCYPFDDQVIIEVKRGIKLRFVVVNA